MFSMRKIHTHRYEFEDRQPRFVVDCSSAVFRKPLKKVIQMMTVTINKAWDKKIAERRTAIMDEMAKPYPADLHYERRDPS